jgi:hypothetical protein
LDGGAILPKFILFLIGPSIPSGNLTGFDRLLPSSNEILYIPHYSEGRFYRTKQYCHLLFIKNRIPARVLQHIVDKAVGKRSMLENKF